MISKDDLTQAARFRPLPFILSTTAMALRHLDADRLLSKTRLVDHAPIDSIFNSSLALGGNSYLDCGVKRNRRPSPLELR